MVQTRVNLFQFNNPPFEGQYADTAPRVIDGAIEQHFNDTSAFIGFGRVVVIGSNSRSAVLPSSANDVILGVTVLNERCGILASDLILNTPSIGYPPKCQIDYMTTGDIIVYSEEAVNYGDPVYYRFTAAASPNNIVGRFNKTSSAATKALPNAKFMGKTLAAGLVRIRLNGI